MMIGRRTFILGTSSVVTAPALASLLSLPSTVQSHASPPPGPLPPQLARGGTDMNCVVFKIDGWDRCDDVAICSSTIALADPMTNDPPGDQVLIRISQSWRTAWR
jgi:hypothetical protein